MCGHTGGSSNSRQDAGREKVASEVWLEKSIPILLVFSPTQWLADFLASNFVQRRSWIKVKRK